MKAKRALDKEAYAQLRKMVGTQTEVAKSLGIAQKQISDRENGKTDVYPADRYALLWLRHIKSLPECPACTGTGYVVTSYVKEVGFSTELCARCDATGRIFDSPLGA